jgi:hypothetical protein
MDRKDKYNRVMENYKKNGGSVNPYEVHGMSPEDVYEILDHYEIFG